VESSPVVLEKRESGCRPVGVHPLMGRYPLSQKFDRRNLPISIVAWRGRHVCGWNAG
jgi:hypothetical protein